MKKIVILIISILLLSSTVCAQQAKDDGSEYLVPNNVVSYISDGETINVQQLDFYPFVFSKEEGREWFNDNVIGDANCQEGYLYSKDMRDGTIRQLFSQPVGAYKSEPDGVSFIFNNAIYKVNYTGTSISCLYKSNGIIKNSLLRKYDDMYYFVENNNLMKMDGLKVSLVKSNTSPNRLFVNNDTVIYFMEDSGFVYNTKTRISNPILNDQQYRNLFGQDTQHEIEYSPSAINQVDTNLSYIYSLYPDNSYFSTSGNACTHHYYTNANCTYTNSCGCKAYSGAIQCVGFAKYAADKYAHLSSWNPVSGDKDDTDVRMKDESDVIAYFSKLTTGAYVIMSKTGDTTYHACMFINLSSTSVNTYDCNFTHDCKVSHKSYTFSEFMTFSPWVSYYVSHSYGNQYGSYNSNYHKQYCTTSGCNGYRLEQHYAPFTGSNVVCEACGYTGNISVTEPLD